MIKLIKDGNYKLLKTTEQTKILALDKKYTYAWITAKKIGDILVHISKSFKEDCVLATGKYRLYEVKNESEFTDTLHMELYQGEHKWQGYLLITGLPTHKNKKNRIIPTDEIITRSSQA